MAETNRPRRYDDTLLGVLACDIGRRPAGAPHFGDLAPALRSVQREGGQLVLRYDASVGASLAAVVAAERLCCAGIGWHLDEDGTTLRVTALPEQLDLLAQVVRLPEDGVGGRPA